MIQKLSHVTLWVLDQEKARDFYVEKLGFEVRHDETLEGFRWLTVAPRGQGDIEIVLMPIAPGPMLDEKSAATLRALVEGGKLGMGVYETDDCRATFAKLTAAGVAPVFPPAERPYGIEAVLRDDSGNWMSIVQRR